MQIPGPFDWQIPGGINYAPATVPNPPTHIFYGRVGTTWGKVDLSVFINNVFNSHPYMNKGVDVQTSTLVYYTTLTPRTVGLDAAYHF